MASRIAEVFRQRKSQGQLAFMPFITAGDPDLGVTADVIAALAAAGCDLIEVGFPYSDPVADGPVIQASYTRALRHHIGVKEIFDAVAALPTADLPPLVAMVSFAIVYRIGIEEFLDQCKRAGFAGLIIPDLPAQEAGEVVEHCRSRALDLVELVAPTTPRRRVKDIVARCSGFVYCIAVAGTTGERDRVAGALLDQLKWLREETDLPLAVGFGISRPEHVTALRGHADGAIVGSAIVRMFDAIESGRSTPAQVVSEIAQFARTMTAAAHGGS